MKAAHLLVLSALAAAARAQERERNPAVPTPAETQQVAPDQPRPASTDLIEDIDTALARARAVYRAGPVAERITMTVTTADGEQRRSTILLRIDSGSEVPPLRTRRVALDLNRLQISADNTAITAVTPREASLYYRSPVAAPLSLDQLWNAVPPVPLPQFEWALGEGSHNMGRVITAVLQTSWVGVQHTRDLGVIFTGAAPGGPARAQFTREGRLIALTLPISKTGDVIDLKVTSEPPNGEWAIDTSDRLPVPSLADLRPRPPELQPGARLPALSLMNKELDSWSLQDELDRVPVRELADAPVFGVIVAYRPAGQTAQQDAEVGARAVSIVRRNLVHSQPDPTRRARIVPIIVGFLDLPDMTRAKLTALDAHWSTLPGEPAPRYFSPTGAAEMNRLAHTQNAAVLVVDSTQKILAALDLDSRPDAETIAQEVEAIIDSALRTP
jgi:hypothetical protein